MQARASRGVHKGTWYFEIKVAHLGASGHCRLGWSTKKGELQVCCSLCALKPSVHGHCHMSADVPARASWEPPYLAS